MCSLAFSIPIRYNDQLRQDIVQAGRPTISKVGALLDAVLLSLQAVERIGYHIPDWSALKIQALRSRSLDVPRVSKRLASFNVMDVVRV